MKIPLAFSLLLVTLSTTNLFAQSLNNNNAATMQTFATNPSVSACVPQLKSTQNLRAVANEIGKIKGLNAVLLFDNMAVESKSIDCVTVGELQKQYVSESSLIRGTEIALIAHPLKERINSALLRAVDDPSDENVRSWLRLKEEAKKKALAFTNAVMRVQMMEIVK